MIRLATLALVVIASTGSAQVVDWATLGRALDDQRPAGPEVSSGSAVTLRALDRVSGATGDLSVSVGGQVTYGRLDISVSACRFPAENPASDAFAYLTILDTDSREVLFTGWMIASSPGLNALDHARFDLWLLNCR